MKRLKKSWAWFALPALCSVAVVGAWGFSANRDADFQWIGPKTAKTRAMLDGLEMRVTPADFQDCTTLKTVLQLLGRMCRKQGVEFSFVIDDETTEIEDDQTATVSIPNDPQPVTVKQFLRMAFRQVTAKEITFLLEPYYCHVKGGQIVVATAADVDRQRARYEERHHVTCLDRIHQSIAEMLGSDGPLPLY